MKNKFDFEKMKEMMGLEVTSESLKGNFDDIIKTMIDLPTRGLKLIISFKNLSSKEFDDVIKCVIANEPDSEYSIVATTETEYIGNSQELSGKTKVLFIFTEDYEIPVIILDSLNKRMIINIDDLYLKDLDDLKEDISKSEYVNNAIVSIIQEPVKEVLGEDNIILEKVKHFKDVDINGKFNDTWNPLAATTIACKELNTYQELNEEDVEKFDDFSMIMSLLSNMDLLSVYQAEKGVKQVSDGVRYNLMKLSIEESLPVDVILRDKKLLVELKRRTINGLLVETIAKNELIENNDLTEDDRSYTIADFINENNRNFTLCLTVIMIEFNISPNLNGLKNKDRITELFESTKRMYIDFINNLFEIDIKTLLKEGFYTVHHYGRHKINITKYQAAKQMKSELSEMLERLKSSEDSEKIESGEIKLN